MQITKCGAVELYVDDCELRFRVQRAGSGAPQIDVFAMDNAPRMSAMPHCLFDEQFTGPDAERLARAFGTFDTLKTADGHLVVFAGDCIKLFRPRLNRAIRRFLLSYTELIEIRLLLLAQLEQLKPAVAPAPEPSALPVVEKKSSLAPIRGAPPGAPVPPFPA